MNWLLLVIIWLTALSLYIIWDIIRNIREKRKEKKEIMETIERMLDDG